MGRNTAPRGVPPSRPVNGPYVARHGNCNGREARIQCVVLLSGKMTAVAFLEFGDGGKYYLRSGSKIPGLIVFGESFQRQESCALDATNLPRCNGTALSMLRFGSVLNLQLPLPTKLDSSQVSARHPNSFQDTVQFSTATGITGTIWRRRRVWSRR
jgi:hypothetical protein